MIRDLFALRTRWTAASVPLFVAGCLFFWWLP